MQNSYMLFQTEGLNFLISVDQLEFVKSGIQENGDIPVYDFGFITGLRSYEQTNPYHLVLKTQKEPFAISVDSVKGILGVSCEECIDLKPPVIWTGNKYLDKVIYLENETPAIVYILDVSKLHLKKKENQE